MSAAAATAAAPATSRKAPALGQPRAPKELVPAKKLFNSFLKKEEMPTVDEITASDVEGPGNIAALFFAWGDSMIASPPKSKIKKDQNLGTVTLGNYYGLIKEYLKDKFPRHPDFEDEYWFTLSKAQMIRFIGGQSVRTDEGEEPGKVAIVRERSILVGEEDVPDLPSINRNILQSDLSDRHERRLAVNCTYSSDGRPGEVKYLNFKSFVSEPAGECIAADWKDIKNFQTKPTTYCTDAKRWEACVLDSFGDHWNVAGGLVRDKNSSGQVGYLNCFAVPMCHKRSDAWTARMLTDTVRDDLPEHMKKCVSGKSLRYGSTSHLNDHPSITHPELIARTGHEPNDNSKHYVVHSRGMQFRPMRALAGYDSVRTKHSPPQVSAINSTPEHLELMEELADKLYPTTMDEFKRGGSLRRFVRDVLATNLMNFCDKLDFLGVSDEVIHRTIRVAGKLGIDLPRLKEISTIIKEDFIAKNPSVYDKEEELAAAVAENNNLVVEMSKRIAELVALVRTQEATISRLRTQLQEDWAQVVYTPPRASPSRHSAPPRRREASTQPAAAAAAQPVAAATATAQPAVAAATAAAPPPKRQRNSSPLKAAGDFLSSIVRRGNATTTPAAAPAAMQLQYKPPANEKKRQKKKKKKSEGSKSNEDSPNCSDVVKELALTGQLNSNTPYESTLPPVKYFPQVLPSSEMTKYKNAMRVVSVVMTEEQNNLYRSEEPDEAEMITEGRKLDLAVRKWLADKQGKKLSGKQKARVLGVGSRAGQLPDSVWPTETGGLFSGLQLPRFGGNNSTGAYI